MKQLLDPWFIIYILAWVAIHFCRHIHLPIPVLNNYLTDFIAVPAMAHVTLTATRIFIVSNNCYAYPLSYLLFIALYTSVIFEWVMPHLSSRYTGDCWDMIAYFAGSIFYYYVHGQTRPTFLYRLFHFRQNCFVDIKRSKRHNTSQQHLPGSSTKLPFVHYSHTQGIQHKKQK